MNQDSNHVVVDIFSYTDICPLSPILYFDTLFAHENDISRSGFAN